MLKSHNRAKGAVRLLVADSSGKYGKESISKIKFEIGKKGYFS